MYLKKKCCAGSFRGVSEGAPAGQGGSSGEESPQHRVGLPGGPDLLRGPASLRRATTVSHRCLRGGQIGSKTDILWCRDIRRKKTLCFSSPQELFLIQNAMPTWPRPIATAIWLRNSDLKGLGRRRPSLLPCPGRRSWPRPGSGTSEDICVGKNSTSSLLMYYNNIFFLVRFLIIIIIIKVRS